MSERSPEREPEGSSTENSRRIREALAGARPSSVRPRPTIPDYELLRRLGEGRFGEVWLARSRETDIHFAVKIVRGFEAGELELDGVRSFAVLARQHPGLIQIHHVGRIQPPSPDEGALYYVMELADGYGTAPTFSPEFYEPRTLASDLARRGPLGLEEAARLALELLDALQHLHGNDLLHRDLKPANVVYAGGRAKLADLGLVTPAARRLGAAGTPSYMPPESVVDPSGDLYCLGRLLFVALTGARAEAFPSIPATLAPEQVEAYRRVVPLLERACAAERSERFQSARELRAALLRTKGLERLATRRPAERGPLSRVAFAGALVALLPLGFLALRGSFQPEAADALGGELAIDHWLPPGDGEPADTRGPTYRIDDEVREVPLIAGGLLEIEFHLDEPLYALVLCVDDVQPQVLFPTEGKDEPGPRTHWRCEGSYPIQPPAGQLTFLLLASREPIEDPEAIVAMLEGPLPSCPSDRILTLGADGVARSLVASSGTRGELGPLIERHDVSVESGFLPSLRERLGERFPLIRAVSLPLVELKKQ